VFVGELRTLKGTEVLIDAVGKLAASGRNARTVIVGSGPDAPAFAAKVRALRLKESIRFENPLPAREAFRLGRVLVVPSLAESLPYVVLEAAAAGMPILATDVGGIPEIFGPHRGLLVRAGDSSALSTAMSRALDDIQTAQGMARELRERVRQAFSVDAMVEQVLAAYRSVLDPQPLPARPS
jgi:glycosyltransferase involved in cell wall biosynthesis